MSNTIYDWFYKLYLNNVDEKFTTILTSITVIAIGVIVSVIVYFLVKTIIVTVVSRVVKKTKKVWDDIIYEKKFFHRLSLLVIPFVLNYFISNIIFINKINSILWIVIMMFIIIAAANSADAIYKTYEISKIRPITAVLQIVKIAVYILSGICIAAILADQNPLVLLGGIGAATAVTSLIFKDAILGFVAGIQLTGNDMIRIGDWIEMPSYSADGDVIDLTMTTVKVQNFDKTITSIPAYALVSNAFINWRGMENAGGRRIKRCIYIDVSSIAFCTDEMLERLKNVELISDYINNKINELKEDEKNHTNNDVLNTRRLTNIGTFREYITRYLKNHPHINRNMITMVRQRDSSDKGIPLEIYTFTDTTNWIDYENIQSDIFDRIYSIAPEFDLNIYQSVSGYDIKNH
ncbi:mechanosensitive ion channel family protein [Eubacteriales bacterium OttesenSCG-928-G02]|nr:mechanosensitive ion channel family protein [Eubacteriales bacterium OttesenSCG-928-G02]